ncbi:hypothetical protein BCR44DRAFT_38998 [Catenaria anguillulae PL171]|uniref:RING-type E3 ubiquitin transferase n=1 Tax=Catenaria anguillulae PL171 TaxID=765915 RepID=A0A1Y2HJK9_9FUNG|nr:hypothetical protein BCR44DRAFT_38998 [Catenaria anguillulae PL171]
MPSAAGKDIIRAAHIPPPKVIRQLRAMSTSRSPSSHRQYWCHECNTSVQSVEGLDDPMCSRCHGSFLEEVRSSFMAPLHTHCFTPLLVAPSWSPASTTTTSTTTGGAASMTERHAPSHCVLVYPIVVPQSLDRIHSQQLQEDQHMPQDLVEDIQPLPPLLSNLFASLSGGLPPRSPTSPTSSSPAGSAGSSTSRAGRQQPDGPDILLARLMHMALHPPQGAQPTASSSGPSSQPPQGQRTTTLLPGGFQGSFQTFFAAYPPPPSPFGSAPGANSSSTGPAPASMSTPPFPPFLATLFSGLGLPMNAQGGFNFGDFVFSQEHLDRIAEQLGQQGPQPQQEGMPDEFFAKGLPDVDNIEAQVAKGLECVICQDKFSVGESGICKLGSCDHMFHRECVEPWLKKNHTCPTCRWDLLAEWKANKEGRDRVPWAEPTASSASPAGGASGASRSEAASAATGPDEEQAEKAPGSWEPEIEPLD